MATTTTDLERFDRHIAWHHLGDFEHFHYNVLAVDAEREIADFIIRYAPEQRIFLHRHRSETRTFVIQGEHRIFEPDGNLKEVRPAGSYAVSPPHSEGGGAHGALVLYNTRGSSNGVLFDVLDEHLGTIATLGLADVAALFEAQGSRAGG